MVIEQMVQALFVRPKERPYQTNNFYDALLRQILVEKEVQAVVQKANRHKKKA